MKFRISSSSSCEVWDKFKHFAVCEVQAVHVKFGISSSNLQYAKFGISSSSLCEVWDKFKQFM